MAWWQCPPPTSDPPRPVAKFRTLGVALCPHDPHLVSCQLECGLGNGWESDGTSVIDIRFNARQGGATQLWFLHLFQSSGSSVAYFHTMKAGPWSFTTPWNLEVEDFPTFDGFISMLCAGDMTTCSSAAYIKSSSQLINTTPSSEISGSPPIQKDSTGKDQDLLFSLRPLLGDATGILIPWIVSLSLCSWTGTMLKLALVLGCLLSIALAVPVSVMVSHSLVEPSGI